MLARLSPAAVLVTLPLLLSVACAAPTTQSRPTPAVPSSAAAAPGDPVAAYCAANAELSLETRELASRTTISDADYAATADAFEQLGVVAPAEVATDLATMAHSYRAIAEGRSDLQKVGPDIAAATLRLAGANTRLCPPSGR
ncbi:hypothetical protein K1T35_07595 [Pseudonocardia sp. DSM 110487]|uniref:hypothetical protein n=1 Tax=Pseudonocardia sp. DSM 110487 TaxID=2865833 RepID=UPI001C694E0A|nr:hypothetical protein [Pseudonocardia sp. DSM 110487]QYN37105.1 hypothetical protein K1T35_07595 [Pseudonocardia sp. DSM 110487]